MSTLVAAEELSFIACPVYRDADAGPKSGCWLATERSSGMTYDIGSGLTKPLADRAVLVEGVLSEDEKNNGENLCGGLVLSPVRVSVLEQVCRPHILPAEGYPGRVFRPPGELMRPTSVARELPQAPFFDQSTYILFNYQSDFLNYQYSEVLLEKVALYISASKPESVRVIGYAAVEPLEVSGQILREDLALARRRAEQVALALRRLQVPEELLTVEWQGTLDPVEHYAGGLAQETLRRVEIQVKISN